MTLDQTLQQCARNTYNQKVMVRSDSGYSGKGLDYATRFLDFINEILQKIAREKYPLTLTETKTLSDLGDFSLYALTQSPIRIRMVKYSNYEYDFNIDITGMVSVPGLFGVDVEVTYDSLPARMTLADLDVQIPFPEAIVSPGVISDYATFRFLYQEGTDYDTTRATPFLNTFNEAYAGIRPAVAQRRVR